MQKNDLRLSRILKTKRTPKITKEPLEKLYDTYNRREYISPDPLQFLWDYKESGDREIVGLIASSLAYGRVAQILKSVSAVLGRIGKPSSFVKKTSLPDMRKAFSGFRHRFSTGNDIAGMLFSAQNALNKYGSLESCFIAGMNNAHGEMLSSMASFVKELRLDCCIYAGNLLPCPSRGSACKKLNLFLRWMVRKDKVDPGVWTNVPASMLIIPLDTHMDNICRTLGITRRKQANLKTAVEITNFFRQMNPDDPVKYDFALTRLGIINTGELQNFLDRWRV